jgi:ubiquinone/menaquinone biosynthesis C-methylase UbiE
MKSQEKIFYEKEGNGWFKRNRKPIAESTRTDPVMVLIEQYGLKPRTVLDIGAANGWRLAEIEKATGAKCVGIEPSSEAVRSGNKEFPKITLVRGVASDIPLKKKFDLVIVSFVLHWVSREALLRSISEIDRMVEDGGHLIVIDFDPDMPTRKRYHHLKKDLVYTYKLDYASILTSTAMYGTVSKMTFHHEGYRFDARIPGGERCVASLLRKSTEGYLVDD